jgi:hypothetical protein
VRHGCYTAYVKMEAWQEDDNITILFCKNLPRMDGGEEERV